MKLKVSPSLRKKRRYLLIEAKKEEIEKAILDYLGILGWAKAAPVFVKSFKSTKNLILAVDRKELVNIRAAFELSKDKIKILKVSGTLKGLAPF
jgi:RNase P/RNase MRP subunit POP5